MTHAEPRTRLSQRDGSAVVSGRFRKRPHEVSASRWWTNGDHPGDSVGEDVVDAVTGTVYQRLEGKVVRFYRHPDVPGERACGRCSRGMYVHGWIDTLEGGHIVCPGDWIVTGIHRELYPVKPDIFELTYEPVAE